MVAFYETRGRRFAALLVILVVSLCLCIPGQAYASLVAGTQPESQSAGNELSSAANKSAGYRIAMTGAKISYSRLTLNKYGVGTYAYYKACKKLAKNGYYIRNQKQMQCNVPVAAAVRTSGVEKNFPTNCSGMYNYMKNSSRWKYLGHYNGKISSLKPGDILIRVAGETSYYENGRKVTATKNHTCLYVGKAIAKKAYSKYLKGTDADRGNPGSSRVFVNARQAASEPSQRRAACLETGKTASADYRMLVFRHK